MTGQEAAEEEEQDKAQQRQRAVQQAQTEHEENRFWAAQMVAKTQLRHSQHKSQCKTQLVPETQLSALSQLSKTPSVELSFDEDSSASSSTKSLTDNNDPKNEPRRSGRVKRLTCDAASQASQDRALAAAAIEACLKGKGKKVRKAKLMNTSQLLDEFTLE
jgi:hypothetical protein